MANTRSAEKRIRTNTRKHLRNTMYRSRVRTMYKKARQSIQSGQPDEQTLKEAVSFLDKAANKGIIHKNNAARRKARLMKFYHSSLEEAEA